MALGPNTVRITASGMLTPSNTALRVYNVIFVSTVSVTNLVLANTKGTVAVTGTTCTAQILIPCSNGVGTYDNSVGMRFENGVFVQSSGSFAFAVITYEAEH